jgi:hypothetical protein
LYALILQPQPQDNIYLYLIFTFIPTLSAFVIICVITLYPFYKCRHILADINNIANNSKNHNHNNNNHNNNNSNSGKHVVGRGHDPHRRHLHTRAHSHTRIIHSKVDIPSEVNIELSAFATSLNESILGGDKFTDDNHTPSSNNSRNKRKKITDAHLKQVLADEQGFLAFMRHLLHEYAYENLLFLVETVQFQQQLQRFVIDNNIPLSDSNPSSHTSADANLFCQQHKARFSTKIIELVPEMSEITPTLTNVYYGTPFSPQTPTATNPTSPNCSSPITPLSHQNNNSKNANNNNNNSNNTTNNNPNDNHRSNSGSRSSSCSNSSSTCSRSRAPYSNIIWRPIAIEISEERELHAVQSSASADRISCILHNEIPRDTDMTDFKQTEHFMPVAVVDDHNDIGNDIIADDDDDDDDEEPKVDETKRHSVTLTVEKLFEGEEMKDEEEEVVVVSDISPNRKRRRSSLNSTLRKLRISAIDTYNNASLNEETDEIKDIIMNNEDDNHSKLNQRFSFSSMSTNSHSRQLSIVRPRSSSVGMFSANILTSPIFIQFPSSCPQSDIVFRNRNRNRNKASAESDSGSGSGSDSSAFYNNNTSHTRKMGFEFYRKAKLLYDKYIACGSVLCINLSGAGQKSMMNIFEDHRRRHHQQQQHSRHRHRNYAKLRLYALSYNELFFVFKECQEEVWRLMRSAFFRFTVTTAYHNLLQIMDHNEDK